MSEHIDVDLRDDGVLHVRFARPEKKNAFTLAMYAALVKAVERAKTESAVRVLFLEGSGGSFTAGNDLQDFMQDPPKDENSEVFQFLLGLVSLDKPVIAAVDGPAVGIGVTMLLHADIVYASDRAKFVLPFVNLGLVPEGASSYLLPRMAGHQAAAELLLFGEPFGAERAAEVGLVNRVIAADELSAFAIGRASQLADRPMKCLLATKALMRKAPEFEVRAALSREGAIFIEQLTSPEAAEAFTAFFEKRKPDFRKLG